MSAKSEVRKKYPGAYLVKDGADCWVLNNPSQRVVLGVGRSPLAAWQDAFLVFVSLGEGRGDG